MTPRPIALIILDGWGSRDSLAANAIKNAQTPYWDSLCQTYPQTTLSASGLEVGLPEGQMGNSEVGHLTMGAGRVVLQEFTTISKSIDSGAFAQHQKLNAALIKTAKGNHALHILGLLSPGGVHSHETHIHTLIKLAAEKGVQFIYVHAFLDGRDTPPQSAKDSLLTLQQICESVQPAKAKIASLCGRYYAMDRDKRWERTESVYRLLTEGKAAMVALDPIAALDAAYERGETDEFLKPTLIDHTPPIGHHDTVVFMNFRADRARQLSDAFRNPEFTGFTRTVCPMLSAFITLTEYSKTLDATVLFPATIPRNMLGEYLAQHHLRQLRIAETEKYAHVTFFFDGGRETLLPGEDRLLIPSPKVATYDLCPEMSAPALTEKLVSAIQQQAYDVIICNYANADMIGHTGNFQATIQAIETLDSCLAQVLEALTSVGGEAIITADHGNAECMFDAITQQAHTAHTLERVPFVYVGRKASITHTTGTLADIAPTLLTLLGLPIPTDMTGATLVRIPS